MSNNIKYNSDTIKMMVKFGNYLLSDERKDNFIKDKNMPPLKDRMKNVTHADLSNYFSFNKVNVNSEDYSR